jgi:signal transduction histidine kinase
MGSWHWILDAGLVLIVLLVTLVVCRGQMRRARLRERTLARVDHLANIGLLAGGLAHEIRNTLNAMHSQLALLRKNLPAAPESPSLKPISQIERALAELEELVGNFLAFARPAQDRLEMMDPERMVRDVLEFAALDLEQGHVKVVTHLDSDLPAIYLDAGKLRRALLNLIVNARQAMTEGGTLTVSVRQRGHQELLIEIADTGGGIREEDQPRIFQSFFSTKPGGTGLGLAIVKRTIEDCGGQITFHSKVGCGTTFRIRLPLAQAVPAVAA